MGIIHKRLVPFATDFFIHCLLALNLFQFVGKNFKVVVALDVSILTTSRCLTRSLVMETPSGGLAPPLPQPYFCALLATQVHYTQRPQPHTVRVHRQQPGDSLPHVSSFSPRVGKQLIRSMVLSHPFCHQVTQESQSIGRESKVDLSLGRGGQCLSH